MTKLALLAGLVLPILFLPSCKTPSGSDATREDLECICGTNEAIMEGCAHSRCLAGEGNPDNPDCVCGPLAHEGAAG